MEQTTLQNNKINSIAANWNFWLVSLALLTGMLLSILSWLQLCIEQCSATQDYRFMGLPFSYAGLGFFITALIVHFSSYRYPTFKKLLSILVATAIGAEIMFLFIQNNNIGHWCPVCVSIAITVGITGLALSMNYFQQLSKNSNLNRRGQIMDMLKKGFSSLSFAFLGFLMAFVGVTKFDHAQAEMHEMQDKLGFGNKSSPINVYFVTDWYCPSCKKVEPIIEKVLPIIQPKVNFYFVDYAIHSKSANFTPYNLAFMVNEKAKYLLARRSLAQLAAENENPNDQDVMEFSRRNHLNFKELTFTEVKAGMDFFEKIIEKYNLRATPVLIITDPHRNKVVKLEGLDEIKENKILETIKSMER